MKRVMVTGGSGFVGGRLVRRLAAEGMDAVVLRRAETDLRDAAAVFDAVRRARPEIIFHCAISRGHPKTAEQRLESLASSVMGTAYLAEAAAEVGVGRFIHVGSSLVYGSHDREFRESDCMRPPSSRGAAKACAALWLAAVLRVYWFSGGGTAGVLGLRSRRRGAAFHPHAAARGDHRRTDAPGAGAAARFHFRRRRGGRVLVRSACGDLAGRRIQYRQRRFHD